ncbi:MAG: DUF58 domain-containing protein [Candidatus Onthomonas sp.]
MAIRWLIYLLALGVSLWCQISYTGYLVHLVFLVLLLLPVLSLTLSLPVMLPLRVELETEEKAVTRGEEISFRCRVRNPAGLPFSRLRVTLIWEDCQAPEKKPRRIRLEGWGSTGLEPAEEPLTQLHCGLARLSVRRVQVWDALGLFVLSRPCPSPVEVLICPGGTEADPFRNWEELPSTAQPLQPALGSWGEDYDLRAYRPGDPMRSVHWKLSSKQDDLVVREPLARRKPVLLLTFDHFGSRSDLDTRLALLQKASCQLLEQRRPHIIRWLQPETGALRSYEIASRRDWLTCRAAVLRDPMPLTGPSIRETGLSCTGLEGPVTQIHLEDGEVEPS